MSKLPEIETEVISDNGDHFMCSRGGKTFKVAKTPAAVRFAASRKKMAGGGMVSAEDEMPGLGPDDLSNLGPWRDLIDQVAKQTGADPYLLGATMLRESAGNPDAVGDKGHSKGLFQIHDQYHPNVPTDPASQTQAAANIYTDYQKQLGDAIRDPRALPAAYNAGPQRVREAVDAGRSPDAVTTDGYGQWVAQKAEQLRRANVFGDTPQMTQAQAAIAQNDRSLAETTGKPAPPGPAQAIGPRPPDQTVEAARTDRQGANDSSAAEAQRMTGADGGSSPPLYENPMFQLAESVWKNPSVAAQAQQERVAASGAGQPQQTAMGQATAAAQGQPQPAAAMGTGSFQGPTPDQMQGMSAQHQMDQQQATADQMQQSDLFGAGAQSELRSAAEQAYGAAKGQALAVQHLAEANLAVNNWLTQESDKLKQQRVSQFQQWQQRGDQIFKQVSEAKIDPNRWFASRSTGQKIAGVIAMALGGMLQGRTGGRNPALDMINQAIERDVDAQKANIDQINSVFRYHMAQGADQREAYALAKADLAEHAAGVLRQNMDRYQGANADAMLQNTLGQIRMQALQGRQQLAMGGLDMDYKKLEMGAARMRTALQVQQMAQMQGRAQSQASGQGLSDQQYAMLPREEQARYVNINGAWLQTPNQGAAGEVREAQDANAQIARMVGEMRKQRQEKGRGWLPGFVGKDAAKARSMQTQMMIPLRKIMQLGVMSEGDKEMLRELVPNVADIAQWDDSIFTRLDQLQKESERQTQEIVKRRVVGSGNSTPVPFTPFQ